VSGLNYFVLMTYYRIVKTDPTQQAALESKDTLESLGVEGGIGDEPAYDDDREDRADPTYRTVRIISFICHASLAI
jgi:hypothetical protein